MKETKEKLLKKSKGITLVALVVTIVILIILATISVSVVLGEDGLIKQAQDASKDFKDALAKEEGDMNLLAQEYANILNENMKPGEEIELTAKERLELAVKNSKNSNGEIDTAKLKENLQKVEGIDKEGLPEESFTLPILTTVDNIEFVISQEGNVNTIKDVATLPMDIQIKDSATVNPKVTVKNATGKVILKYYIKEAQANINNYNLEYIGTNTEYTFTKTETWKIYMIKVEAIDEVGNLGKGITKVCASSDRASYFIDVTGASLGLYTVTNTFSALDYAFMPLDLIEEFNQGGSDTENIMLEILELSQNQDYIEENAIWEKIEGTEKITGFVNLYKNDNAGLNEDGQYAVSFSIPVLTQDVGDIFAILIEKNGNLHYIEPNSADLASKEIDVGLPEVGAIAFFHKPI